MRKDYLTALVAGLFLSCTCAAPADAQTANQCDLNGDGSVNLLDMQLAGNMVTGQATCTSNVIGPGVCNIALVQRVTNAALTGSCITGVTVHSVSLSWAASTSSNVTGYNIYRGTQTGGPYTKINAFPVAATTYTDTAAQASATYYYVTTAVDSNSNESAYSNEAQAVIPFP